MSGVGEPTSSSLLERDLPPTPNPTSPVPSFSDFQENYVPPWMRDAASTASTTRHSRASSIVSTLTRFTTTSIDDARSTRSIDIQVGGQNFRIARDASKITSEAPPPYTAAETRPASPIAKEVRRRVPIHTPTSDTSSDGSTHIPPLRPRVVTTLGANILDPTEVDIPSPVGDDDTTPPSTPRISTRNSDRADYSINPLRIDSQETLSRTVTVRPYKSSGPRQRSDLPLLSATSNALEMQGMRPRSTQLKMWQTMSADDLLLAHPEQRLEEPQVVGGQADGVLTGTARLRSDSGYSGEEDSSNHDERSETPSMDSENDISLHYARMIRFVDKQHRRALHARDKEMEQLRNRLAELDTVYRQQLKAKDFIIEDLKKRLDYIEDSMDAKLERARNEVEDLWERRWKDRDFHLRERMSRLESQASRDLLRSRENLISSNEDE